MAVTPEDVLHVASLARLGVTVGQAGELTTQLNTILGHMAVLSKVDAEKLEPVAGVGADPMPLRRDEGPAVPLDRPIADFAPSVRDGFFLVPRLSTHEAADEG
ncbi:MAG TPA: Asp-tRNA(Asn)/Glu-tRNA(Gln) amidotransferase subunit GatC [Gemmatimonadaceae bacterium]|nr:Asp-tRNA(Asn)/Glu-tRNA(Gln) amidotransferase subunit GatC [Gemmatimonadaceae bacterium]